MQIPNVGDSADPHLLGVRFKDRKQSHTTVLMHTEPQKH